ncbi:helix-turn-helix domain-containing protein [Heyndrickxia sp. NPDC080065]|uniref:helix-turn-helix domain-containing protein n=1 Tax=Heyndrickxia sp. NPDC080065 TaxID=3390568 RepID=UPI003CFFB3A9
MNFLKKEELNYICNLLFTTNKIPMYVIDDKGNLVLDFSENLLQNPLFPSRMDFLEQLMLKDDYYPFPVFQSTTNLENFFSIQLFSKSELNGIICVGPVLYSRLPDETINGLIHDLQLNQNKEQLIEYYQSLPVITNLNFINMSMALYYMLFQEQLDMEEILLNNHHLEKEKINIEAPEIQISEQRKNTKVHHDFVAEKKLFDSIQAGKKTEVLNMLRALPETGEPGILSKRSHLRSQKNLAISGITLATRAAVSGGLYPEIAYTLSDFFIQNLEELNDSNSVMRLLENAVLEFTERVEQSNKNKYSKPIYACQNYIFTHLYEDITLPQLAEIAAMNPSYLSTLFKKEVDMSISEYIQRAKVDEAKNLITYTSHSLTEISTLLNFHDQSHFTKIFKKYGGVTPKQFKNGLLEVD